MRSGFGGRKRQGANPHLVAHPLQRLPGDPGGEIRFRFTRLPSGVLVEVWDAGDRTPEARPIRVLEPEDLDLSPERFDDNGGWGLPLRQALATACGMRRIVSNGK